MIRYATSRPPGYHNDFEGYLYNQNDFLTLKGGETYSFYALNDAKKAVVAQAHFIICSSDKPQSYHATNLPQSPFGSIEFSQQLEEKALSHFMAFIKEYLLRQQVISIQINECIAAYRTYGSDLLLHVLHRQQFVVQEAFPNHHIVVDTVPFEQKLHQMESKRLRKCIRTGFYFRQEPIKEISYYYQFIQACRQEKGWSLSMTLDEVKKVVATFPERYKIFAVYDQKVCIAACLTVVVNERTLYVYAQASLQVYNRYSPVVLLLAELYQYCREQKIRILDLGTSPTNSLQTFKTHMGGVASEKLILKWVLK